MVLLINRKQISVIFIITVIIFTTVIGTLFLQGKQVSNLKEAVKDQIEYLILIYIEEKKLYLYENGKCIKEYFIASGTSEWPSPLGHWKITDKSDWGEGFGGRWMGINVPWGTYGIHGTTTDESIGYAASHGCIRMHSKDAKELYNIVPIGTPVIIKNASFGPFGSGFRVLMPGDRGADVLAIQQRLKVLGYFKGWESGIYDDDLKYALHRFQKDNNLQIKNDITRADYHAMGFREFE